MVTLTYMPTEHVPVLAAELIRETDPRPGETVVDCTFGGGGHARLIAERIGPDGTLIAIDRDPAAEERFEQFAAEVALRDALPPRRLRRGPRPISRPRASAPTWSSSTSACPRCRSTPGSAASPTPTTRRSTCGWTRRQSCRRRPSSTSGPRAGSPRSLRDYGEERHAGSIAREIVERRPARDDRRAGRRDQAPAMPPSARFGRGHPAKRTFQAIRIAVNGELDALDAALPAGLGACSRPAGGSPRSRSTRSRTAASSASSPTARAAASARPSSRSASAAASPRPSCSPARDRPERRGGRRQPALGLGAPARRRQARPRRGRLMGAPAASPRPARPPRPKATSEAAPQLHARRVAHRPAKRRARRRAAPRPPRPASPPAAASRCCRSTPSGGFADSGFVVG